MTEHVEPTLIGALKREIVRQCMIGAGTVSEDVETGLISVNADLDPYGLRKALTAAVTAHRSVSSVPVPNMRI